MKLLIYHAIVSMILIRSCMADGEQQPLPVQKLSADFGVCPDGHKALKDVPILWGHLKLFEKDPKDYTDSERELSGQRDRGEIVFGGDIMPSEPPKFRVICDHCGFTFHPSDFTSDEARIYRKPPDWDAYWSRSAKDFKVFKLPFSKKLLSFPLMKAAPVTINYSQSLTSDGKRLKDETISFHSSLPFEEVLGSARNWLKDIGRNPAHLERDEGTSTYTYYKQGIFILLIDEGRKGSKTAFVSLSVTPNDTNKPDVATPNQPPE